MTAGKTVPELTAETPPIVGTDELVVYRSPGPLKRATAATVRTYMSAASQPLDADLTAIAALTSAADKLPYATGAQTWAMTDLTAAGRALLDDASAEAQQATLGTFATRALAIAATIPAPLTTIALRGYTTAGDGGAAIYKRAGSEPSHAGKLQSADGQWWVIAETSLKPAMFGAIGAAAIANATTDESAAILALLQTSLAIQGPIVDDGLWHGCANRVTFNASTAAMPPIFLRLCGLTGGSFTGGILLLLSNIVNLSLNIEVDAQNRAAYAVYLDSCPNATITPRLKNVVNTAVPPADATAWHLHIANSSNVLVFDPQIDTAAAYVSRGIHVADTSPRCTVFGGKISNMTSTGSNPDNDADGVVFDGATSVNAQGWVNRTRFENIGKRAVKALAGNVLVENVTGTSVATYGYCAISFYGALGGIARNCNFVFTNQVSIVIEIGSSVAVANVEIVGNSYSGPSVTSGTQRFIKAVTNVSNLYVARNRAADCSNFFDAFGQSVTDAVFEDNSSTGCFASEIQGLTATRVAVRRHKADYSAAGYLLGFTNITNCEVTDCTFNNFGLLFFPLVAGDTRLRTGYGNINGGVAITEQIFANGLVAGYRASTPSSGRYIVGDRFQNSAPTVGQPKAWVCTVAGYIAPAWAPSTVYSSAYIVRTNDSGKIYLLTTAGTSAGSGGPTGTGSGITDGSCVWDYLGVLGTFVSEGNL
jgi:hypothetical protein